MSCAPPSSRGSAAAIIALGRNLGMLTGTALCSWLYSSPHTVLLMAAATVFVAFVCMKQLNTVHLQADLLTN